MYGTSLLPQLPSHPFQEGMVRVSTNNTIEIERRKESCSLKESKRKRETDVHEGLLQHNSPSIELERR
jgi:hypothetical protein